MEKIIKGLECCTFILGKRKCNECPYQKGLPDNGCYQLQDDFHALLKEQQAEIEQLNRFVNGFSRDAMPVVRCKDCRHCSFSDGDQLADCMIKQGWFPVKPDWFCADGKRKEGR